LIVPMADAAKKKGQEVEEEENGSKMVAGTFAGLELRSIGPSLMSGRIADIAMHPEDKSLWYVAVGSGGVWKTENAGTTWENIFDDQPSYSIGSIVLDPNNPSVVWVGTGENVGGRHVGYGDGVYKSLDGGTSWQQMGLEDSQHIGNIVIDPRDSDVVYVASQGPLWSKGGDRGLFKTVDGGETWEKILGEGDYVGVNEVQIDPRDPDTLYAATHQRFRTVAALIDGGPGSGIHKSTDGGATWRKLSNGLPKEDMGKIGLAVSPIDPDVVYATIEAKKMGGFYRSADRGETWEKQNEYFSGGTGAHYYQEIFASPHKFDRVYQMDPRMQVTEDGGKTWRPVGERNKHGDNHALVFDLDDPNYLLDGSDGGIYESFDLGKTWKYAANLPITQFYKVAIDYDEPFYNVVGGTQDNSTQHGPARTDNVHGIRNSDWMITVFADGHQPAIDPTNPNIIYSEWQEGNLIRHDRKTGEIVYIQPQSEPGEPGDRWNWDSPILISAHDPARLYYASQRIYRSDDRGDSWRPVSDDLSRGEDRLTLPMMDRVWSDSAIWDMYAMSNFGNVTSLGESPLDENLLYAGTDDGLIQVSEDGGASWRATDGLPGVPNRAFVNDVKADLHDADTVYVALDDHKTGDFSPYLMKSSDRGRTWTSIAGDLPERHLVWRVVQDHEDPDLLFVGTEFGVFFTVDGGSKWVKLTGNAPNIPFRDLVIQKRENDLVGATFGRSFWVLDDYTSLREVDEAFLEQDGALFPIRDAWWYIPRRTLGGGRKASQGDAFYVADNPPFGAVITYYLKDKLMTSREERRKEEKEVAKESGDTPYPGYEALKEEVLEAKPEILLTVSDAAGNIVRRLQGTNAPGIHRIAWDLRYPTTRAGGGDWFSRGSSGFLAPPGTYTVTLSKRIDGELTQIGESQTVEVVPLWDGGTLAGATPEQVTAFMLEVAELVRVSSAVGEILDETDERLEAISEALAASRTVDLDGEVHEMKRRLYEMRDKLEGDQQMQEFAEPEPASISKRLMTVTMGNQFSTYGPTPTHMRSYEIAQTELAELKADLEQLVEVDIPALEERMDAAGVAWSKGRAIP
jgi:photosystem II stability/assembly factor-like uncharacterized protein